MGAKELFVDPTIIRGYVQEYWSQKFPEHHLSVEVGVSKDQKLEMFVELPPLSFEKQKEVLENAESELGRILQRHIGYKKDFALSVLVK